eukprot:scaffold74979_cov36-Phaeocystis_antarctica.AAC.2
MSRRSYQLIGRRRAPWRGHSCRASSPVALASPASPPRPAPPSTCARRPAPSSPPPATWVMGRGRVRAGNGAGAGARVRVKAVIRLRARVSVSAGLPLARPGTGRVLLSTPARPRVL